MAVHHVVGISRQRNSGYRPSRVNIMAQGHSTPDPSLNSTHLSIRRGCATTTHYTYHQVSLMVSSNTILVPSMRLRIGPACEAGLSAGMRRQRVPLWIRKKERKKGRKRRKKERKKERYWKSQLPMLCPKCVGGFQFFSDVLYISATQRVAYNRH